MRTKSPSPDKAGRAPKGQALPVTAVQGLTPGRRSPRTLEDAGRLSRSALPLGPNGQPQCRWCTLEILAKRRRTFCSDYCVHQFRLRSDPGYLRDQVFARDKGICALCQTDTMAAYAALKRTRGSKRTTELEMWGLRFIGSRRSLWDADHILPVVEGGGQCALDNLRTLCLLCHREVTAELRLRLRLRRLAGGGPAIIPDSVLVPTRN